MTLRSLKILHYLQSREASLRLSHTHRSSSLIITWRRVNTSVHTSQIPVFNIISYTFISPGTLWKSCLMFETYSGKPVFTQEKVSTGSSFKSGGWKGMVIYIFLEKRGVKQLCCWYVFSESKRLFPLTGNSIVNLFCTSKILIPPLRGLCLLVSGWGNSVVIASRNSFTAL